MKLGFVGGGKMAEALMASMLQARAVEPHAIFVSDVSEERRKHLKGIYGVNVYSRNTVIPNMAELVILAVKPQQLDEVFHELQLEVHKDHLVISIAAGKTVASLQAGFPEARIIRVMPNMGALVGHGMTALCKGRTASDTDVRTATKILSCSGKVLEIPEAAFDAVTALSGSGPAFFAFFMDAMIAAGMAEGLSQDQALEMAQQTMLGTAHVISERGISPRELITSVASAKGTTAAGLDVMEPSDLNAIVRDTLAAAARRSKELSG
jgi:pyrroline-5-carboxylate reductase